MKQDFTEPVIFIKDRILNYQMDYINGHKSIRDIAKLVGSSYNYTSTVLGDSFKLNITASEKEQENNLQILELLRKHSKPMEIVAPNIHQEHYESRN